MITLGAGLRLWAAASVGLGYGEAYYYSCSLRPALSYFDHPPLSIWLIRLSAWAFGSEETLALRTPFLLCFAGSTWGMYRLTRRLFGDGAGVLAAAAMNAAPVFSLAAGAFLGPDGPLFLFWLLALDRWAAILLAEHSSDQRQRPWRDWLLSGAFAGLALLSKYSAVFLGIGLAAFLATDRESRRWLRRPEPYGAACVAFGFFLPVVLWNGQNDGISFAFQGGRGIESAGISFLRLLGNILGQAIWILPGIWLGLVAALASALRANPIDRRCRFLTAFALAPIVFFTAVALYAPVGFHFHWQAPGYLAAFPLLGRRWAFAAPRWRTWIGLHLAIASVLLALVCWQAADGAVIAAAERGFAGRFFPDVEDPTLECLDYSAVRDELDRRGLLSEENVFLFSNRWFLSGKLEHALRGDRAVHCIQRLDPRGFAFWKDPQELRGKDGVLIALRRYMADPTIEFGDLFGAIEPLGSVPVTRGGRTERVLELYRCRRLERAWKMPYGPWSAP